MDPRHGDKTFKTLGDPPFPQVCRDEALAEIREAGLPRGCTRVTAREVEVLVKGSDAQRAASAGIYIPSEMAKAPTEWVDLYTVEAEAFGWTFRRAWYYWVCRTTFAAVPLTTAAKLHESHGNQVRVDGSCACPAPTEDVLGYHVDTPAGLAALVAVLREQHEQREADREKELRQRYART